MTSGIEASGEQSGNMHRDLVRALGKRRGSPDFFEWTIPMQGDGAGGQVQIKAHPFILPHEMFSRLHAERLETFFQCVQGDDAERGALWDGLVNLPVVQKHPSLDPNQKHPSLDPNLLYRTILLSAWLLVDNNSIAFVDLN